MALPVCRQCSGNLSDIKVIFGGVWNIQMWKIYLGITGRILHAFFMRIYFVYHSLTENLLTLCFKSIVQVCSGWISKHFLRNPFRAISEEQQFQNFGMKTAKMRAKTENKFCSTPAFSDQRLKSISKKNVAFLWEKCDVDKKFD